MQSDEPDNSSNKYGGSFISFALNVMQTGKLVVDPFFYPQPRIEAISYPRSPRTGLMWSYFLVPVTNRATEF